jgi:hypothetical protein
LFLPPRLALALDGEPFLHPAEAQRVLRRQATAEVVVGQLRQECRRVVPELGEAFRREVGEERARTRRPAEREVARNLSEGCAKRRRVIDRIYGLSSGIAIVEYVAANPCRSAGRPCKTLPVGESVLDVPYQNTC